MREEVREKNVFCSQEHNAGINMQSEILTVCAMWICLFVHLLCYNSHDVTGTSIYDPSAFIYTN